jgi:hypothetical protein
MAVEAGAHELNIDAMHLCSRTDVFDGSFDSDALPKINLPLPHPDSPSAVSISLIVHTAFNS